MSWVQSQVTNHMVLSTTQEVISCVVSIVSWNFMEPEGSLLNSHDSIPILSMFKCIPRKSGKMTWDRCYKIEQ
jgi:hypothetical protein